MTAMDIVWACVGFFLCVVIFTVVCLLIVIVVCWMLKTGQDIEIETEDWEEENDRGNQSLSDGM